MEREGGSRGKTCEHITLWKEEKVEDAFNQ